MYPWDDAIPPEDLARYLAAGYGDAFGGDEFRAISAGASPALIVVDMTLAFVDGRWPTGCSGTGWPAVAATARLLAEVRPARASPSSSPRCTRTRAMSPLRPRRGVGRRWAAVFPTLRCLPAT